MTRRPKLSELLLVNQAVDQELSSYVAREAAMQSRATILIGAASLVGAVQVAGGYGLVTIVNLALTLLAAVCGVVVIFPRNGNAPDPMKMHAAVKRGTSSIDAVDKMIDVKLEILHEDEKSLSRRGGVAQAGFVFLALSIVVVVAGSIAAFMQDGGADAPVPLPVGRSLGEA